MTVVQLEEEEDVQLKYDRCSVVQLKYDFVVQFMSVLRVNFNSVVQLKKDQLKSDSVVQLTNRWFVSSVTVV